jgi:hypothetical protein
LNKNEQVKPLRVMGLLRKEILFSIMPISSPICFPNVFDAASSKQGKFLPGSHIPILMPDVLRERQPDIVLIFPWDLADEVIAQHEYACEWGEKFVTAIPKL